MEMHYSANIPAQIEKVDAKTAINFNVQTLTDEQIQELWNNELHEDDINQEYIDSHRYRYNRLIIGNGRWTYNGIVDAIIRSRYTIDQMESITNNMSVVVNEFFNILISDGIVSAIKYLVEYKNSEEKKLFNEMQEWRSLAKHTARNILKIG